MPSQKYQAQGKHGANKRGQKEKEQSLRKATFAKHDIQSQYGDVAAQEMTADRGSFAFKYNEAQISEQLATKYSRLLEN